MCPIIGYLYEHVYFQITFVRCSRFAERESEAQTGKGHCAGYWLSIVTLQTILELGGLKTPHLYYAHKFRGSGIWMGNSTDSPFLLHGV